MEQQPQSNPFSTMHKQRLYSFIIAVVAFITLILPWINFGLISFNGFRSWGILSMMGALAIIGMAFYGNRELPFDATIKNVVMAAFGAIALGALIFMLTMNSNSLFGGASAGVGLWLCLIVGIAGLAFTFGVIKIPEKK